MIRKEEIEAFLGELGFRHGYPPLYKDDDTIVSHLDLGEERRYKLEDTEIFEKLLMMGTPGGIHPFME